MLRFAGYELDPQLGELRAGASEAIRLRPKSFEMLQVFARNARRVLSKQELIEAVWPNVHVGEDSLFQCVSEIRAALGDDQRLLLRRVANRGYMFDTEVTDDSLAAATSREPTAQPVPETTALPAINWFAFGLRGRAALAAMAGLGAIIGIAAAAPIFGPDLIFARKPPSIAVMPITGAGNDPQLAEMAANVTERLTSGLARINQIRVVAPQPGSSSAAPKTVAARAMPADFVVSGELQKSARAWDLLARMTSTSTGEVRWTASVSVGADDADLPLQQSRLAAGLGHPLALRLNALINSAARPGAADGELPAGNAGIVIEQATAFINQTTRDRFAAAQAMLERALAADPDNVDLEVALAAHLLRGLQSAWYDPAERAATERSAQSMLERALRDKPNYIPALEAQCRLLTATNHFVESLIACARTLSFDPWDGIALFQLGITQLQLARFEEALATFTEADRFDTPQVSRWTWLLGAGWTCMLMGHDEDALPWLQRSIAITPGTGRTHLLLAAAYQRLGRSDEARAALAKAMELRPGSTSRNVVLPSKNASPAFLDASERITRKEVEVGLPEG